MFITNYGKVYTIHELGFVPSNCYDLGCGLVMGKNPTVEEVIHATMGRITFDYAVPQPWFDEWTKNHDGVPPRAIWAYDKGSIFGRPVHIGPLEEKFKRMVLRECSNWMGGVNIC